MIRWSYVIPRAAVILLLLALAHYGVPWLLRWSVVRTVETVTGTQTEVRQAWASLVRGEVRLQGVEVARAPRAKRNTFQCEAVTVDLDLAALARRRLVINDAQIRGIRFNTQREAEASQTQRLHVPAPDMSNLARQGEALCRPWLEHTTRLLQRRVEDEFQSLQTARQLAERWPQAYGELEAQVRHCHRAALELHQSFTTMASTPLHAETLTQLQQLWNEIVFLRQRIAELQDRVQHLAGQVEADRAAVAAALRHDGERLRQTMTLTDLTDRQLDRYLLDEELRDWWTRLAPWLQLVQWLNSSPEVNPLGQRGRMVVLDADQASSRIFLRNATLDGQLQLAGQDLEFVGRACDWSLGTAEPAAGTQRPARMVLLTRGPWEARVEAAWARTADGPLRQLSMKCDRLALPARHWGHVDDWTIDVAPGNTRVSARLETTGDQLEGQIQLVQDQLRLTVVPAPGVMGQPLWQHLAGAIEGVDQLTLTARLTGTLDAPQWTLSSNVGAQLQERFQAAAGELVSQHRERLVAEAERRLQDEWDQVRRRLPVEHEQWQQQLTAMQKLLASVALPATSRWQSLGQLLQRF